jgi:hypothetical protein
MKMRVYTKGICSPAVWGTIIEEIENPESYVISSYPEYIAEQTIAVWDLFFPGWRSKRLFIVRKDKPEYSFFPEPDEFQIKSITTVYPEDELEFRML